MKHNTSCPNDKNSVGHRSFTQSNKLNVINTNTYAQRALIILNSNCKEWIVVLLLPTRKILNKNAQQIFNLTNYQLFLSFTNTMTQLWFSKFKRNQNNNTRG